MLCDYIQIPFDCQRDINTNGNRGVHRMSLVDLAVDPDEIVELAAQLGEPLRWARSVEVTPRFLHDRQRSVRNRRGEAVLAVMRPGHRVLLHHKAFYAPSAYRLLSGGIRYGEPARAGAERELAEETGLTVPLVRFAGVVEYDFHSGDDHVSLASYLFLTGETGEPPHVMDAGEAITDFWEADWNDLAQTALALEQMPAEWSEWGRFRAVPHRMLLELPG